MLIRNGLGGVPVTVSMTLIWLNQVFGCVDMMSRVFLFARGVLGHHWLDQYLMVRVDLIRPTFEPL